MSEEAHCGGPQGRAALPGTLGYERKALGSGISLHGGSVGQPGVGSSTGDSERGSGGGALFSLSFSLSLYGNSVKETWREGSLTGNCGG